jgi:DNA segregation ATPase FtsK/SpoIIIE-like protein
MNKKEEQKYIVALEDAILSLIKQRRALVNKQELATQGYQGGVYIIRQKGTNHYKIGQTRSREMRMQQFGVRLPFEIEEVAWIETPAYIEKERELHELFAEKRLNGSEFFELDEQELQLALDTLRADSPTATEKEASPDDKKEDVLLKEAEEIVVNTQRASASYLQTCMGIGYARASRLMKQLEDAGIVSEQPSDRSGQRLVLVTRTEDSEAEGTLTH